MSDPIIASVSPPVADSRPEPPPFPVQYALRYWFWSSSSNRWLPLVHGSHNTLEEAQRAAQLAIEKGHKNIAIVTIPGDTP